MREPVDMLLVSPATTAGWRRADGELTRALEGLGVSVASCTSDYRLVRHLRRTMLITDLAEAVAARRALTKALRRYEPRAVVYSSPQATMLQPRERLRGATAARFDAPVALNRRGFGSRLLRALERRGLGAVSLLLPFGLASLPQVREALDVETPTIALPVPLEAAATEGNHDPIALAYAANPHKKGLDLMARAWQLATPARWRLVITGIDQERGRRFLQKRRIVEPEGIEWAGLVEPDRYRKLSARASIFLAASRFEDYGIAQLEALADGKLLVTVPSDGPYEALHLVRALDPRLVSDEVSAEALARALGTAVSLSEEERSNLRSRAQVQLRPYSRESFGQRLAEQVLPALLG